MTDATEAETLKAKFAATELRLRTITERYALATRAARVGVWDWNLETRYFFLDPNVKALLGYEDHEIPNDLEAWSSYVHPDDREGVTRAAQDVIDGRVPEFAFEHRMRHKDGSFRWFMGRGSVVRNSKRAPIRFLGTNTDITDRVNLEREVRDSSNEVQAQIGHDLHDSLGQELTALALKLAHLERQLEPSDLAVQVRDIRELVERAIGTTEALARGLSPVLNGTGLAQGLAHLAENARRLYGIECEVTLADDVGGRFPPTHANELYRIAQEALTNAVRHGRATRTSIEGRVVGSRFLLNIVDNGVGIGTPDPERSSMCLRIMQYRARTLGGSLTVSRLRNGGTLVVCACPMPR
jgi:PAS domain S-box-containing protein